MSVPSSSDLLLLSCEAGKCWPTLEPVSDCLHKNQTLLSNFLIDSIEIPVGIKTKDYYIVWTVYRFNGADECLGFFFSV